MAKAKKAKAKKSTSTAKAPESAPVASQEPAAPKEEPKAAETSTAPPEPAKAPQGGLRVAPGKSITSLRGILGPGEPVHPHYFAGGQQTLSDLKAKGLVV